MDRIFLSTEFLMSKGKCCGLGCLYCPYKPRHRKGSTQIMPKELYDRFVELDSELIAMDVAKKLDK